MNIARKIVTRPTTFLILYLLLVGLGFYVLPQIPLDLFPDINPPILVLFTQYPGAGPEEVEKTLTRPLEGVLTNVSGIQKLSSVSSEGESRIILELGWGDNLSEATNEVRDKIELVKDFLPEEASTPQIFKFDPSLIPIIQMSIEGNQSPDELYTIAENQIQPRLEQIDGVGLITLSGGREPAVRVEVSQNRLEAYGLSLSQVVQTLLAQNIKLGSGNVFEGNLKYLVETQGEFEEIDQIRNAVITYRGGSLDPFSGERTVNAQLIRLRDLADVKDSYKEARSSTYVNGKPGIYIAMQKKTGTNSVQVVDNILTTLDEIRPILPADVSLTVIYDTSKIIRSSLNGITSSALLGIILAMGILFIFLRNLKSTVIIGLSIPISLLVTLIVMYFANLTLNIMTLAGLTLGIGMIVDSSIVILENIYRYREKGAKLLPSAYLGTQEMLTAITASVLTTVGIFLPLLLFKKELDIIGVLFQDLALTIVISLLASLLVAISLVPLLSSKYLKIYTSKQRPIKNPLGAFLDQLSEKVFQSLVNGYKKLLTQVLHHKGLTTLIIVFLFILSFFTLEPLGGNIGIALAPQQAQDVLQISAELPIGTRYETTEATLLQLAELAKEEIQGYQDIFILVGSGQDFFGGGNANTGTLFVTLPPFKNQIDSYSEMLEKIRAQYDNFPSVNFDVQQANFLGNATPIDIILKTENLEKAQKLAEEIKDLLKNQVEEVIEPQISLPGALPIANIVIDRNKAYSLGLSMSAVANEISAAVNGQIAGRYRSDGEERDILVILNEEDRNTIANLHRLSILNQKGERVPMTAIAQVERSIAPVDINREDRSRVLHITARQKPGFSLNTAESAVRNAISNNLVIDEDIVLEYSGEFADLQKYIVKFVLVMAMALFLVYGIMASLFESLKNPFNIFLSIFLIIPGIFFMYAFLNLPFFTVKTPLSMFSAVGLLMLVGIAVNNGIVLVDYMNLLHRRGLAIREAIITASANRLRPVLMTSLTTILGMLPLAFSQGDGSELVRPIGQTIVGGMLMSTLLTLFFVPLLYAQMNKKSSKEKPALSLQKNRGNA